MAEAVAHSLLRDVQQLGCLGGGQAVGPARVHLKLNLGGSVAAGEGQRLKGGLELAPVQELRSSPAMKPRTPRMVLFSVWMAAARRASAFSGA